MTGDRQMLLELGGAASVDGADLIVTPAHAEVAQLVEAWPHWSSPVAVITGPPGSGKTHFGTVWAGLSGAYALPRPGVPRADDIAAAEAGRPILCDGLAADGLAAAAVFHRINAVRSGGASMLITADGSPARWPLATPDLVSRLRAATMARLRLPDDALLHAVAVKLFADRQVTVDPAVIGYLLPRIERSLPVLAGVVDRLDRAALARKSPITRALAAAVLDGAGDGNLDS